MGKLISAAGKLDKLYEFDREPVSSEKLQGGSRFAGLFAGEHVAATEPFLCFTVSNSGRLL